MAIGQVITGKHATAHCLILSDLHLRLDCLDLSDIKNSIDLSN